MTVSQQTVLLPDEHVEVGNCIKDCRDSLLLILKRTRVGSRIHRNAAQAIDVLDRLRTQLDRQLHMTVAAHRDPRLLLASVYSGTERLAGREYTPDDMDRDDFAAWELDR